MGVKGREGVEVSGRDRGVMGEAHGRVGMRGRDMGLERRGWDAGVGFKWYGSGWVCGWAVVGLCRCRSGLG
mgnify:CR=1 FL=1